MPRVLIAGCGFVGLATAELFHDSGWEVFGCTHSPETAARLADRGFPIVACDISDQSAVSTHREWNGVDAVIHCASSGRGGAEAYRRVYLHGARTLTEILRPRL